jgi:hypothetical protein
MTAFKTLPKLEIQSPKRIRAAIPSTGEYKNNVSDTVE